jgi:hypothetical protein
LSTQEEQMAQRLEREVCLEIPDRELEGDRLVSSAQRCNSWSTSGTETWAMSISRQITNSAQLFSSAHRVLVD